MTKISRAVLNDIADLCAMGLNPAQIAKEVGTNIHIITKAIDYIDRQASREQAVSEDPALALPGRDVASRLGERYAALPALSRVEFFDRFGLSIDDIRDGYNATALWHIYLDSRARARKD
ncbi:hypothetical protein [Nonomuraea sp. NPDC052265]|uniref:hypothetical protein n=1 Tax=Nonomuraea sp. NPDC052265 TaxID=3364374 RepID=UPI0037C882A7